jgi:hypothetical protein
MSPQWKTAEDAARELARDGVPGLDSVTDLLESAVLIAAVTARVILGRSPRLLTVKITAIADSPASRGATRAALPKPPDVVVTDDGREVQVTVEVRGSGEEWLGEATVAWA